MISRGSVLDGGKHGIACVSIGPVEFHSWDGMRVAGETNQDNYYAMHACGCTVNHEGSTRAALSSYPYDDAVKQCRETAQPLSIQVAPYPIASFV